MKRIIHPLLLLVARATEKELVRYIEYLKAEIITTTELIPDHIIAASLFAGGSKLKSVNHPLFKVLFEPRSLKVKGFEFLNEFFLGRWVPLKCVQGVLRENASEFFFNRAFLTTKPGNRV